jgi:hypothetical protein
MLGKSEFRKRLVFSMLLGFIAAAVLPPAARAQPCLDAGWAEHESNPVIDPVAQAYYPTVLYDGQAFSGHGETSVFKLWTDVDLQYYISDDGVSWTFVGDLVDGTITGMVGPRHCHVEYFEDGFAESPDGKTWHNDQALTQGAPNIITGVNPDWNRGTYGPVDVLYNPDAANTGTDPFDYTLVMYYEGTTGGQETIGMGYSADGIHWIGCDGDTSGQTDELLGLTGDNTDWDYNYTTFGTVLSGADGFRLWYSGGNGASNHGIGYAKSPDGIDWTRDADNPIFHKDDGVTWRTSRTYTPSVVDADGRLMMFFTGRDGSSNYAIGLATYFPGGCSVDGDCYADGESNPANPCQVCDIAASTAEWSPNDGIPCDDGLWCNGADTCAGESCSEHDLTPEEACPQDGAWCDGAESCDEAGDTCVSSGNPCADDGAFCNGSEYCDETTDACASTGDPCADDGAFCNGTESCDEAGDTCVSSGNPCADDGLFCTGSEYCDETTDACVSSRDPCGDNGSFCDGAESCDETTDACVSSGNPCADNETCEEASDSCNPAEDVGTIDAGITLEDHFTAFSGGGCSCSTVAGPGDRLAWPLLALVVCLLLSVIE